MFAACSSGSGSTTNPISDLERLEAAAAAGEHVREPDAAGESDPDPVDLTPLPGAKQVEIDKPGRTDVEFDGFVAGNRSPPGLKDDGAARTLGG